MVGERTRTYFKFQGRIWLNRLGLWRRLERWRLGRRFRAGQPHEQDFRFFRHLNGSNGLFVDIGANIGQSALSFRLFNNTCPILSFEPNTDLEIYLRYVKRLLGDCFEYRMYGFGARNQELDLYVPVVRGVPLSQEATLFPEALQSETYRRYILAVTCQRDFEIRRQKLRLVRFDDLGLRPGLVKMDVERAELAVLQGMEETLRASRPLLVIEGYEHVQDFLAARDYRLFMYAPEADALVPFQAGGVFRNSFFVPAEMMGELKQRRALCE